MALKKILFMDTSFRDGFQSVFGARVRTEDFIPAVEATVEAGIRHLEFGGGARFQSLFFYCQESAFDMMDRVRHTVGPDVNLQTLSRGINVVGLSQQPRDIIDLHARMFRKHGTTSIRNFDALNDMRNLEYSARCIKAAGLNHQVTVTLMGLPPGIADESVHTADFYVGKVKEILESGIPFDSICFKDASGTCPPEVVFNTLKKTRDMVGGDVVLWFHTHDTVGAGIVCLRAAIRGGADGIDLAQQPVSGGTGQPDLLSMWHALRYTEYTLDIDYRKVVKAEQVFQECMSKYMIPPEAFRTTPDVVLSPMPGGALTTNTMMMRDSNTLHLYPQVLNEMANVVAKGGFGTSVTPVSQFYFQQAYMNVIKGPWKKITDGYGNMVLGYFGRTPVEPDPEVVKLAEEQLGKPRFTGDPIDILADGVPTATDMLNQNNLPVNDENVFIVATCKEKGISFLKDEAPLQIYYNETEEKKRQKVKDETEKVIHPVQKPVPTVPDVEFLTVTVNGEDYDVVVRAGKKGHDIQRIEARVDMQAESPRKLYKAPKPDHVTRDIPAPLSGVVIKTLLIEGTAVQEGQPVIILEAMKMETIVYAPFTGVLLQYDVSAGDMVKEGQALFMIQEHGS